MTNKKLNLSEVKIQSFVTSLKSSKSLTIQGAGTQFYFDCTLEGCGGTTGGGCGGGTQAQSCLCPPYTHENFTCLFPC